MTTVSYNGLTLVDLREIVDSLRANNFRANKAFMEENSRKFYRTEGAIQAIAYQLKALSEGRPSKGAIANMTDEEIAFVFRAQIKGAEQKAEAEAEAPATSDEMIEMIELLKSIDEGIKTLINIWKGDQ